MDMFLNAGLWVSMLRTATPIALAAMGGALCQKAGVFNIALEGHMLVGAFAGISVVHYAGGNVSIGLLGAMLFCVLYSAIYGTALIRFKANHIIASIAMNIMALGLTSYLLRAIFRVQGSVRPAQISKLAPIRLPLIDDIPFLGEIISRQNILTYFMVVVVILTHILLNKTRAGLNICSAGESEDAAETAGVNPDAERWRVILICGGLCGLAGAYLSTNIVSQFSENMVQGRGFSAFTAVAFSDANPISAFLVSLLFGLASAISIRLELMGTAISPSIIEMFPFVLAIAALALNSYSGKLKRLGIIKRRPAR